MPDPYWQNLLKSATDSETIEQAIARLLAAYQYFVTVSVWGMLPKSGVDDETIEEAINRLIAVHEADSTAHLGSGESLEAHKTADVIDHPAYSVIDDKTKIDKFTLQDFFGSLSAYDVTGLTFNRLGYAEFYTSTALNNVTYVYLPADDNYNIACDRTKNPIFETVVYVNSNGTFQSDIGMGDIGGEYQVSFRITKTNSYAVYVDDDIVEHTIALTDISKGVLHKLRIEIVSGVSITWFVDNVQVATVDISAITLGDMRGWVFGYRIKNLTAGQVARIGAYRVLYQQDL